MKRLCSLSRSKIGRSLAPCGRQLARRKRAQGPELRSPRAKLDLLSLVAFVKAIWLIGLLVVVGVSCRPVPVPTVIDTIKVSPVPYRVALDPTTSTAYVLHTNNTVSILQGAHLSNTVQFPQKTLSSSGPIVVQPRSGRVYVFDSLYHLIRVVEPNGTFTTIQSSDFSFYSERRGQGAIANPVTGYVYAINLWDRKENDQAIGGSVLVITGTEIIARVPVGRFPSAIAVNPVNGWIYVGDYPEQPEDYEQLITIISGTQVIAKSDMGWKPEVGGGIAAIIIDPHTGQVFTYISQRLFALRDLKPIREKLFDRPALQIMFNPVNGWLYAMMMKDEVLVMDTNLSVVERISIQPQHARAGNSSMAIDPIRGYVYVGSTDDGTLTVIRDTKVITTLQVGWDTTDIVVDPQTGLVYAVNNMSGDVTIVGFPETTK